MEGCDAAIKTVEMTDSNQYTQDYVIVLLESLQKKVFILDRIINKNDMQRLLVIEDPIDADAFEENLNSKSELIKELEYLDSGFEVIYDRVKEILSKDRALYKEQILEMQQLIRKITEMSTAIQVQEQRNKVLVENSFAKSKKNIGQRKTNQRIASKYYQNMNNAGIMEPRYMDSKK
jgi:predicted nuclease with TOPRIM domain